LRILQVPLQAITFLAASSCQAAAFLGSADHRDRCRTKDPYCNLLQLEGEQDIAGRVGYNVAQEEFNAMTGNSVVRARIDERTKREAAAALKKIGLTVSDAFRLLLVRVAAEKALPFEPLNPNAETVAAMKAARRGELVKAGKPDKLLQSLNAGS
jgi:DNA-damage-inducible protein J